MLGIIIVIYKSYEQIFAFVKNELPKITVPFRAVIVNVGSKIENSLKLSEALNIPLAQNATDKIADSPVIILHADDNLGYARGNNYGVRFLLNHHDNIEKLLFSNDDIELITPNLVSTMALRLDNMPSFAAIGPGIVDLNNKRLPPFFSKPNIWYIIKRNFGIVFLGSSFFEEKWNEKCGEQPVYALAGCFFMVNKDDFMQVGMFDERTFLYWEELILGAKFHKFAKNSLYYPSVSVRHFVGNTTKNTHTSNRLLVKSELEGQKIFFWEYANLSFLPRTFLCISQITRCFLVSLASLKHTILTHFKH